MDNSTLKANARNNMQKNHWLCVVVAFFMSWSIPTFNLSLNLNSDTSGFPGIDSFESYFENFFSPPSTSLSVIDTAVLVTLATFVISTVLKALVFNVFQVGGSRFFLKQRKNQPTEFAEVFVNFKDKTFLNIAKVTFIRDILIVVFTFLFIVPGIIKTYQYWAVTYILAVRPDINHQDALRVSKEMM